MRKSLREVNNPKLTIDKEYIKNAFKYFKTLFI